LTLCGSVSARETVAVETWASRATSARVAIRLGFVSGTMKTAGGRRLSWIAE